MSGVAVVDYGMGNLRSVVKALEHLGADARLARSPSDLREASRIVMPGVGAFGEGMAHLRQTGLISALTEQVRGKGKPFLGICLGMQMLAERGFEEGEHEGLGWVQGEVRRIEPSPPSLKLPHVGWNDVAYSRESFLFKDVGAEPCFYFTHSYHLRCRKDDVVAATCDYGGPFAAAVSFGNIAATQFHPEKSQEVGLRVLDNFLEWTP